MTEEKKGNLLDNVIDAVTIRDEVAAAQAAKKEAEAIKKEAEAARKEAEEARARANLELAKRQEAEVRANKAEADLKTTRGLLDQEVASRRAAESKAQASDTRAQAAEAKVKALEAEMARLKQEQEQKQEQAKARTYIVKAGDSLSKIAIQFYGDAKRWPEIHAANKDKISDPNVIHPGQELRIP